jgi:predicted nucleotide-binding protein
MMTTPTDGGGDAEWMSAAEAIALLPFRMRAICAHAKAGLVKTHAKLFIDAGRHSADCDVPPEFWWAEGGDALQQDWASGHFVTWVRNHTVRLEAFGVEFRRSDIIEHLKPASGATKTRTITPTKSRASTGQTVFIGHGHSPEWLKLEKFLRDRLRLTVVEFNSVSPAGVQVSDRLKEMLRQADFAFLIMTGEDEQATGKFNPRLNVVHEAGLFQGKLGFEKAIILREEGCEDFSNVDGLGEIRFPKGTIGAKFESIRKVLEREGIVDGRMESSD